MYKRQLHVGFDVPIRKAAAIIEANMQRGRIPDDGFLLLASVPYDEIGVDRARAELKSRFLSKFAADVIGADFPRLGEQMRIRTAVLDWRSRTLEAIAAERQVALPIAPGTDGRAASC